ncbi:MAG TPA: mechanosensitive ion channel family protein, partial [Gammaproteobacteria bacterium]|nr:mechanosensitive ion channel family protein [Gammaproteobacteria bacterium]
EQTFDAVGELPSVLPSAWAQFSADREEGGLLWFVLALIVSMGSGGLAALVLKSRVTPGLKDLELAEPESTRKKAGILLTRFGLHLAYVAAFAFVALAVYVLIFDGEPKDRVAFLFYLLASVIFLTVIALSVAYHAPRRPALRLPLYSDAEALRLHRTVLVTAGFGAFAYFTCALTGTLGVLGYAHQLFLILVGVLTATLMVVTILAGRQAISNDLASGARATSARGIFSRVWPWCFAVFVPVLLAGLIVRELLYDFVPYGAALATVALMAVVPGLDALLYRDSERLREKDKVIHAAVVRGTRLGVLVLVVALLCAAWRINPFAMGEGGIGTQIANALLQISLTLLIVYGLWQIARISIDKKIAEEDAEMAAQGIDLGEQEIGGTGLSRTRTLLPLVKRTVQITLAVVSLMIILNSLGVEITPLLAGAGVVGLAIGFGSQTLVRDIVSGAFFLMDDAFRIGEYIDVGSVKGAVEKMSARSVRLRHHRGAIHTVPFGEIKTLTNYSRDWAIMKLAFRVPFDTDVDKVRKILKQTGLELARHPDIKDDFIQPFKSQGATEADDHGFIIKTKFMSKPGKQYVIRRYAFAAVQKAFKDHGIEFATPKVEVIFDEDENKSREKTGEPSRDREKAISGAAASQAVNLADGSTG